jgi:hypothetical protein
MIREPLQQEVMTLGLMPHCCPSLQMWGPILVLYLEVRTLGLIALFHFNSRSLVWMMSCREGVRTLEWVLNCRLRLKGIWVELMVSLEFIGSNMSLTLLTQLGCGVSVPHCREMGSSQRFLGAPTLGQI